MPHDKDPLCVLFLFKQVLLLYVPKIAGGKTLCAKLSRLCMLVGEILIASISLENNPAKINKSRNAISIQAGL